MPQLPSYDPTHPREIPVRLKELLAQGSELVEYCQRAGLLYSPGYGFDFDVYERSLLLVRV